LTGKTISHYKILEKLGAGGMGEVYRAEDLRLHRQVAVKVLPDILSADPERLARFEREAKLLAALSHPNIAAIHGLEEAEGKRFLILELVEGETLAQRIKKGPLPADDAFDVCRQIAEGLEAAHEKSIVHRDLKPSNIKITPEGKVKILDFGLARAFLDQSPAGGIADSPTITAEMTRPGVILGTAAYMSPEQAKGKSVDRRVDIWAFGCILYECLTAKMAFPGETITEVLASILKGEPDWEELPKDLPANVRAVLSRCLQKDRNLRYHDIADAKLDLFEAEAELPPTPLPARRPRTYLWAVPGALAMIITGLLIGFALMRNCRPSAPSSVVTSIIKVESDHWLDGIRRADMTLERPSRTAMAISNDGKFIVYSAIEENPGLQAKPQLYLRKLEQPDAQPISGTEGGINPFLSPDGRWVGFWADQKVKKAPIEGGVATVICDAPSIYGANWSHDNRIVFTGGISSGLSTVSSEGGTPEILTRPDAQREESSHRLPSWLPNSQSVLFTVMRHGWDSMPWIALLRLETRDWKILIQDAADARYVSTGHLVFLRQGTLMAVRFDLAKLETIGQPVALVENVMQSFATNTGMNTAAGQYGISEAGSLVYGSGGIVPDPKHSLVWVDRNGTDQPITAMKASFYAPRLSPDGQRVAYEALGRESHIWIYDLNRGTPSRLTAEGRASAPVWTFDGKRIVFAWQKSLARNLFWQPFDGSLPMERLTPSGYGQYPSSCAPDGKTVALLESNPDTSYDIVMADIDSGRTRPFLNSKFQERYPEFSPDGRWIAYSSDESGREDVYVRPFPNPGAKFQISNEGGSQPLWARDGRKLFYRRPDQVWAVDVLTAGGFVPGKPRLLFEKSGFGTGSPIRNYDLSLDSQRFLMVKNEERKPSPATEMILVQNWFEELKRLVPAKK